MEDNCLKEKTKVKTAIQWKRNVSQIVDYDLENWLLAVSQKSHGGGKVYLSTSLQKKFIKNSKVQNIFLLYYRFPKLSTSWFIDTLCVVQCNVCCKCGDKMLHIHKTYLTKCQWGIFILLCYTCATEASEKISRVW